MGSVVPFLTMEQLRRAAQCFLDEHHPSLDLPTPIDVIAEFRLRLDIVPVPGLAKGGRGINGYVSSDKSTIYVDDWIFQNVSMPTKMRVNLPASRKHRIEARDFSECRPAASMSS